MATWIILLIPFLFFLIYFFIHICKRIFDDEKDIYKHDYNCLNDIKERQSRNNFWIIFWLIVFLPVGLILMWLDWKEWKDWKNLNEWKKENIKNNILIENEKNLKKSK